MPPQAEYRGAGWADEWRERLEQTPVWLFEWLRQQHDGPYWRQGSLAPGLGRGSTTPIFLDRRLDGRVRRRRPSGCCERCTNAPRRALIGNWVHDLPDDAYPAPNLDWHHEMVRFFDHWLKGVDNGVMDEPGLVAFRHEWAEPEPFPAAWPGAWIAEAVVAAGRRRRAVSTSRRASCRSSGGSSATPAGPSRAVERFRHRPTIGTRGRPVVGRRRPAERRRPRPPPGRRARPDVHASSRSAADLDVVGVAGRGPPPGSRRCPVATAVVRLAGRRPGRHAVPGQRRDPQPHPSRVARGARATRARASSRRSGSPMRSDRPSVPGRPPDPAVGRVRRCGPSSGRRRSRPSTALHLGGDSGGRGSSSRRSRRRPALRRRFRRSRRRRPGLREIGSYRGDPPTWQVIEDVIAGSVTVASSEFGESDAARRPDDASTPGERLEMTAARRRSGPRPDAQRGRLPPPRATAPRSSSRRHGTTRSDRDGLPDERRPPGHARRRAVLRAGLAGDDPAPARLSDRSTWPVRALP